jgi:hypothetical protein
MIHVTSGVQDESVGRIQVAGVMWAGDTELLLCTGLVLL